MFLLRLLLSCFCFDWEDISNTRESVSSAIQTPRILSKILRCASYLQLSSPAVFGYPDETLSLVFDILLKLFKTRFLKLLPVLFTVWHSLLMAIFEWIFRGYEQFPDEADSHLLIAVSFSGVVHLKNRTGWKSCIHNTIAQKRNRVMSWRHFQKLI